MVEEIKTQPAGNPEGQGTPSVDTGNKSAEDRIKDMEASNKKLSDDLAASEKRIQDKDAFIGKQSTEIGELRGVTEKHANLISKAQSATGDTKDKLVTRLAEKMVKDGMTKDDAEYNAKLVAGGAKEVFNEQRQAAMIDDLNDMIDDALEGGSFDKKVFTDNEAQIMADFKSRKPANTARRNFKLLQRSYNEVVRKKADVLRTEEQKKADEKRDAEIAAGAQPAGGGTKNLAESEKSAADAIANAGVKRNSAFF